MGEVPIADVHIAIVALCVEVCSGLLPLCLPGLHRPANSNRPYRQWKSRETVGSLPRSGVGSSSWCATKLRSSPSRCQVPCSPSRPMFASL